MHRQVNKLAKVAAFSVAFFTSNWTGAFLPTLTQSARSRYADASRLPKRAPSGLFPLLGTRQIVAFQRKLALTEPPSARRAVLRCMA